MSKRMLRFPDGFLWGVASSAHQTEGHNHNNDFWAWEQDPAHIADGTTSGAACNWWQMAEEDFARAAGMGVKSLRLSLEWSRLEPRPGVWDSAAFDRYRSMLKALREFNIEPMLSLHHFTSPLWLAERGGWTNPQVVEYFLNHVVKSLEAFKDLCHLWCTIIEPTVYATHAYILGKWPPGLKSVPKFMQVSRHQVAAHAAAYRVIHDAQPHAEVGIAKHMAAFAPASQGQKRSGAVKPSRLAGWSAAWHDELFNWRFLQAITEGKLRYPLVFLPRRFRPAVGTCDYHGINYYGRHLLKFAWNRPTTLFGEPVHAAKEVAWPTPWEDREMYAKGLYDFLRRMAKSKNRLYITENGIADATDEVRPAFLLKHLAAIHRAISEGVDVRGYYHWALVDNYEWVEGWTTRFGLIALDPETQERTPRRSAALYSAIAKMNGIGEEVVEEYAPECMSEVFDGKF